MRYIGIARINRLKKGSGTPSDYCAVIASVPLFAAVRKTVKQQKVQDLILPGCGGREKFPVTES
jgi:hypothetical protein